MNKSITLSNVFYFDKPIVYIQDFTGKTIGFITMDDENDLYELKELIRKAQENENEYTSN